MSKSSDVPAAVEERLRELLEEHGDWLRTVIGRTCPHRLGIDASEVEQQVRIRLWRALERESEVRRPASFLYRIVATATIDAVRRHQARREDQLFEQAVEEPQSRQNEPVAQGPDPEQSAADAALLRAVALVIDALPANRALVVRLHLQGFTTTEAATLLGWTEAKARNLVYRGLDELRQRLRDQGIEYLPR